AMIAELADAFFAENATSARTRAAMAGPRGIDEALWRAFASDLGMAGVTIPLEFGGSGLGYVELAIVAEAAGKQVAALPLLATMALAASALLAGGSDEQKRLWLPRIAAGEAIASLAGLPIGSAAEAVSLSLDGDRLSGQ